MEQKNFPLATPKEEEQRGEEKKLITLRRGNQRNASNEDPLESIPSKQI